MSYFFLVFVIRMKLLKNLYHVIDNEISCLRHVKHCFNQILKLIHRDREILIILE
jgi:hypothetical protein